MAFMTNTLLVCPSSLTHEAASFFLSHRASTSAFSDMGHTSKYSRTWGTMSRVHKKVGLLEIGAEAAKALDSGLILYQPFQPFAYYIHKCILYLYSFIFHALLFIA